MFILSLTPDAIKEIDILDTAINNGVFSDGNYEGHLKNIFEDKLSGICPSDFNSKTNGGNNNQLIMGTFRQIEDEINALLQENDNLRMQLSDVTSELKTATNKLIAHESCLLQLTDIHNTELTINMEVARLEVLKKQGIYL